MINKKNIVLFFRVSIIIIAFGGFLLNSIPSDEPFARLTYFTSQSNVLVGTIYLVAFFINSNSRTFKIIKNQIVVAIVLTGLVFNLMLRPYVGDFDYNPNTFSDFLVHVLTPILVFIDFIFLEEHGEIQKFDPFYWLLFPLIYWVFTIVFVALGGDYNGETYQSNYPYFFLDFKEYGIGYFFLVFAFVLMIGYILFIIDYLMIKRKQNSNKEDNNGSF